MNYNFINSVKMIDKNHQNMEYMEKRNDENI